MLKIQEILSLIGYNGECYYRTLQEVHDDPDMLFSPSQRLKLDCIKNIALELQTSSGTEYVYPEGYDPEECLKKFAPLENVAHRKLFHLNLTETEEEKNYE